MLSAIVHNFDWLLNLARLLLHFEEGLISPHFFAASPPEHSLRPKAHHKAGVEGPPGPPAKI